MNRRYKIEVKPEHIKHGVQMTCTSCPIALAVKEIFGPDYSVEVFSTILVQNNFSLEKSEFKMPQKAHDFIDTFDDGGEVQPITFTMERIAA